MTSNYNLIKVKDARSFFAELTFR